MKLEDIEVSRVKFDGMQITGDGWNWKERVQAISNRLTCSLVDLYHAAAQVHFHEHRPTRQRREAMLALNKLHKRRKRTRRSPKREPFIADFVRKLVAYLEKVLAGSIPVAARAT